MKKQTATFSIQIAITLVFLYLTFRSTHFHELKNSIQQINFLLLISAVLPQLMSVYILALREKYMLIKLYPFKITDLIRGAFISIVGNNTLPLRAGEFLKTYYWAKLSKQSYLTLFSIAFLERILDLCILMLLFFCASKHILNELGVNTVYISAFFMVSLSPIGVLVYCNYTNKKTFSNKVFQYAMQYINKMAEGIQILSSKKEITIVVFLSIVYWALNLSTLMLMLSAFHFSFTIPQSIIILLATSLGVAIPSAPGYIGTLDYFTKTVLVLYGINHSQAASFAITSHIVALVPITLIGLFFTYSIMNQLMKSKNQGVTEILEGKNTCSSA